jgi:hypothetical protein
MMFDGLVETKTAVKRTSGWIEVVGVADVSTAACSQRSVKCPLPGRQIPFIVALGCIDLVSVRFC